ncbi:MAG: hypothetical protein U0R27_02145 [Candidatus Nanopelagicales bacterium]
MVSPILEELAGEHDEIVVAKPNVDENSVDGRPVRASRRSPP